MSPAQSLTKTEIVDRLVRGLKTLSQALLVYDRALLYYDGVNTKKLPVDTTLTYDYYFKRLPPTNLGRSNPKYLAEVAVFTVLITSEIAGIYAEAIKALASRFETISELHEKELNRIRKRTFIEIKVNTLFNIKTGAPLTDRDPAFAAGITQKKISDYNGILTDLRPKLKCNHFADYCSYEVEYEGLAQRCLLIAEEVSFLCKRVDELQAFTRQSSNEKIAYWSAAIAITAIAVGTFWDWKGYRINEDSYKLAIKNTADAEASKIQNGKSTLPPIVILIPDEGFFNKTENSKIAPIQTGLVNITE